MSSSKPSVKVVEKFELRKLIQQHIEATGTDESFFIVDVGDVVRKYILWNELLPRIEPDFAFKANNHESVVSTLAALGCGFDCASIGEIEKVLAVGGVKPSKIVFSQTVKPVSHINYAKQRAVKAMTFDNEEELLKVQKHFPDAELLLRLSFHPKSTMKISFGEKFGCPPGAESERLLRRAAELKLNVKGIHFHIGFGCMEYEAIYAQAIKDAAEAFKYGSALGLKMDLLDIGGGYPGHETETITSLAKVLNASLAEHFPDEKVKVISEPGCFFVDKSFTLVANVHSKNVKVGANGPIYNYYITDGIYQSFNMTNLHEVKVTAETLKESSDKPTEPSVIWGRACDSYDVVCRSIELPIMECGDWLLFENSGAYRISTATTFNGFANHPVFCFIERETWETFKKMKLPNIDLTYDVEE